MLVISQKEMEIEMITYCFGIVLFVDHLGISFLEYLFKFSFELFEISGVQASACWPSRSGRSVNLLVDFICRHI